MKIDGKTISKTIVARLRDLPRPDKFFGAALVGDDSASLNFLKQKENTARELGIDFRLYRLPKTITTDDLKREIRRLAEPKNCGGFIAQLPFPEHINRHYVLNAIPKDRDVDFLGEPALGAFYTDRHKGAPPSVLTVQEILSYCGYANLRNLKVVVIGAGFLIGKPVGFWFQNRVAELTVLDSGVSDVHARLSDADIVVSGAGHPHLFAASELKKGALVIDFGFSKSSQGNIVGDFNSAGADDKEIHYTPMPGGTGPILVAKLYENFYHLNA